MNKSTQGNHGSGFKGHPINGSQKTISPTDTSVSTQKPEATASNVACRTGMAGPPPTPSVGRKTL